MSSAQPRVVADRYRLVEPLGQGGMGRVWKARDELLHRDVAIKELVPPPGLTNDERQEMRERTLREARAIARLSHPNVVRIFDILRTDGDPWIVMEYVASRSLQDVLAQDGPMSPVRVAEIGLGMLGALRAAHRAGVVHRDVKPGNVLLGDDGRVVLTDFGLATVPGDPVVTRTGLVLGSPAYIAPERAHDGTAGPTADMWSLGATLYAAVEGQSPFARPSAIATLAALATEPPAPARRAGALKPLFSGLLRKDPAQRMRAQEAEQLLLRAAGRRPRAGRALLPGVRRQLADQRRPSPARSLPPVRKAAATAPSIVLPSPRSPVEPPPAEPPPEPPVAEEPETPPDAPDDEVEEPEQEKPDTVRETTPPSDVFSARAAVPVPEEEPAGKRPAWLLAAVAAGVALIVLLVVVLWDRGSEPESGARPGPSSPAASATAAPQPTGTTAGPTPPAAPPGTSAPPPGQVVLPPGWRMYRDPTGFSLAAPNWPIDRRGTIVYFREPRGQRRVLGIDQSGTPKPDPVADWRQLESRRVAAGDWFRYRRVRIDPVNYFVRGADWEYTYERNGTRLHALNRGFIASARQAHAILWITPDASWADNLDEFDLIARTFRPIP